MGCESIIRLLAARKPTRKTPQIDLFVVLHPPIRPAVSIIVLRKTLQPARNKSVGLNPVNNGVLHGISPTPTFY